MRNGGGEDVIDKMLLLIHHLLYHLNLPILLIPLYLYLLLFSLIMISLMLSFIIISKTSKIRLNKWKISVFINLEKR
jgi:hypothetical protein